MQNKVVLGTNRTGLGMAPLARNALTSFAAARHAEAPPDDGSFEAMEARYVHEAERVGAVPLPTTLNGLVSTGFDKLRGRRPEVLIDKLGERLAFERTGTRLYEALIRKCEAVASQSAETREAPRDGDGLTMTASGGALVEVAVLRRIRDEEEDHFHLVVAALRELGADPTAMTPCADTAGVMAQGLIQAIADPRTTVPQCLNAILTAELADNAGWDLLIELAAQAGHPSLAMRCEEALIAERAHLTIVSNWLREAVVCEAAGVAALGRDGARF